MAKAKDESKDEGATKFYNPHTAQWEPLQDEALKAEHEAQVAGKPAPGDRTEEDLLNLEPGGTRGPVLTADENLGAISSTGGAGGASGGTEATGGATGAAS